jgi:hypothetical protein
MNAEGWYVDPFGLHEARWISDGEPTALVRDGSVESHDAPPAGQPIGPLEPVAESAAADGSDLRRADSAEETTFDPATEEDGAWDVFGVVGGGD